MLTRLQVSRLKQDYLRKILSLFEEFPKFHKCINEQAEAGYLLMGYKGTNKRTAESIEKKGISVNFKAGEASGTSCGEGFYTTLFFKEARDYARNAVRVELSYTREDLKDPEIGSNAKVCVAHDEACRLFYESPECHNNMYIVLVFAKDFFLMNGLNKEKNDKSSSTCSMYDYLEGKWELKFNLKEKIYNQLWGQPISFTSLKNKALSDLPNIADFNPKGSFPSMSL